MIHSQYVCFSNVTNDDAKTIVEVCDESTIEEDNDKFISNDTKMLLNVIGK